ncbi:MAG: MarC family protein [Spirochaetota bacterium]
MSIYAAAITLILVMDPFGNIPLFLSILESFNPQRRKVIILREMVIAFVILTIFLFFGKYILSGMHISEPALSISGGVILFLIAIKMIFPSISFLYSEKTASEPLIVPLAVPFVAGPSSMTMVIFFSTKEPHKVLLWFLALTIAWLVNSVILFLADIIRNFLGDRIIKAIERLMGMILTTLAVQLLLTGIKDFLTILK